MDCSELSDKFDTTFLLDTRFGIISIHCPNYSCWAYCSILGSLNGRYSLECVYIFLNIYDFILVLLTSLSFKSLISQTEEVNASFSYR